ncbi:TetR/AcrR family transcriptional regulator, partial [Nocardia farcinica]|uniref:TetR/AcrR family transcriptional regulator n=1 Tax=Nocardia farcinica TaxID=37329 RepID=UPI00245694FE
MCSVAAPKNSSDPARTLTLLWGLHPKPGRKGLTVATIVAAGIEVADAEGLDAVTMRRVSERLGVGAMSLYTHVPGKTDLVELMHDAVLADLYRDPGEPAAAGDWRAGLTLVAQRNWQLYQQHPWLLGLIGTRPVPGPHSIAKYEAELRPLDGLGHGDVEMDAVLTLVLTHVQGTARLAATSAAPPPAAHHTETHALGRQVGSQLFDGVQCGQIDLDIRLGVEHEPAHGHAVAGVMLVARR